MSVAPLVVKLGGGANLDVDAVLRDLAALQRPWVLVHGGNAELNEVSTKLGHQPRFVTSPSGYTSRVTDLETIRLIQMVYRGRINSDFVLRLQAQGCNAVGLSGIDGRLWQAERKEAIRVVENGRKFLLRDDYTGKVVSVNTDLLRLLLDNGYRPVLTLPALANDGSAVNVSRPPPWPPPSEPTTCSSSATFPASCATSTTRPASSPASPRRTSNPARTWPSTA
jgi:[amino group carrier protein]-L-2-aminoadipate 6-kinase